MADSGIVHVVGAVPVTQTEYESEAHHSLAHGTSFPAAPAERQLFYRDDLHKWYVYNGTSWLDLTTGVVDHLNDIGDVNVPAPTDGYVLYWDDAAGKWQCKAVSASKIQDADGDTSWDVEQAADEDKIRGKVKGVEAFKLNDDGILDLVKQSGCSVYVGTNQTVASATDVTVEFDTESYDIQGEFDPVTNYRFTAKKAGYYVVTAALQYLSFPADQRVEVYIYKNANAQAINIAHASHIGNISVFILKVVKMAVGEHITIHTAQYTGSDQTIYAGISRAFMTIHKLA